MKISKSILLGLSLISVIAFSSCQKEYGEYSNMEVVENSFGGDVLITSGGEDPACDFTGSDASGAYSFAWENPNKKAAVNFDITSEEGGSVQVILNDARGDEVLNETRFSNDDDTFAGVSQEGRKGTWLVTVVITNIDGDGSFSINPAE